MQHSEHRDHTHCMQQRNSAWQLAACLLESHRAAPAATCRRWGPAGTLQSTVDSLQSRPGLQPRVCAHGCYPRHTLLGSEAGGQAGEKHST